MKIKFNKDTALSLAVLVGTGVLALMKTKDDANKEAAKKEAWISEAVNRMTEKKEEA